MSRPGFYSICASIELKDWFQQPVSRPGFDSICASTVLAIACQPCSMATAQTVTRTAYSNPFELYPDPTFHPDPTFQNILNTYFGLSPDPTFYPDPAFQNISPTRAGHSHSNITASITRGQNGCLSRCYMGIRKITW